MTGAAVEPQVLEDIKVGDGKSVPAIRRISSDYGNLVLGSAHLPPPNKDAILELRAGLFAATHHLGVTIPAVHALQPNLYQTAPPSPPFAAQTMPPILNELSHYIVPNSEVSVHSKPTPVALYNEYKTILSSSDVSQEAKERFINSLQYNAEDLIHIEEITRGQSLNIEWYKQRMGSVTSSVFGEVRRFMDGHKISASRLIKSCIGLQNKNLSVPPKPKKAALKWGVANEATARVQYEKEMKIRYPNFEVTTSGLVVHPKYAFLRASPDGIAECAPNHKKLIEIKCPYSVRLMCPHQAIKENKLDYIGSNTAGGYFLKQNHRGYYEQVQGAMAICGLHECDFIVWTKVNFIVLTVEFDHKMWSSLLNSLASFFQDHIVPEILTGRLTSGSAVSSNATACDVSDSDDECVAAVVATEHLQVQHVAQSVQCKKCHCILPEEDYIAPDNSDASVGCECNCGCSAWYCWTCANFTEAKADALEDWLCPYCEVLCI